MYVCICNAVSDRDVARVIRDDGAQSVAQVYRALDVKPCCGRCGTHIKGMIESECAGAE
jgi:bacterioferritin-associated ferredoxin